MAAETDLSSMERAQDELVIQRKLAEALRVSLAPVTHEPLPNEMALLLLQLALAETVAGDAHKLHVATGVETELVVATQHVARAKLIVARQYQRVAELQAEGRPTQDSMVLLATFIQTLAAMEYHHRLLRDEVEGNDQKSEWIFSHLAGRRLSRRL